jgi:hypothetical protein
MAVALTPPSQGRSTGERCGNLGPGMTAVGQSLQIDTPATRGHCPLHSQERPNIRAAAKRRFVPQAAVSSRSNLASLLNHLVGAGEQCVGHGEAKRLGGPKIDDELKLGGEFDWQIGDGSAF